MVPPNVRDGDQVVISRLVKFRVILVSSFLRVYQSSTRVARKDSGILVKTLTDLCFIPPAQVFKALNTTVAHFKV